MGQAALPAKARLYLAVRHWHQTLAAAGLDKLWPAQWRGVPTLAKAAQGWRMGEEDGWVQQSQGRAAC